MIDPCGEVDLGRLEGVVGWEMDGQEEDAAGVGGVALYQYVRPESLDCLGFAKHQEIEPNRRISLLMRQRFVVLVCIRIKCTYWTHDCCLPVELQFVSEKYFTL